MVDGLHGGMAHFLALAPTRGGLRLGLLTVMLPETDIHIFLNRGEVLQDIGNDSLLNGPTEEIQLAHCCLLNRRLAADLETDSFATAKRIKEALGIRLEFAFVMEVDEELSVFVEIGYVELLGIVGHEPVYETEADWARAGQNRQNLFKSSRLIVECLEPHDDEVLLPLNAILECLACGIHSIPVVPCLGLDGHRNFVCENRGMDQMDQKSQDTYPAIAAASVLAAKALEADISPYPAIAAASVLASKALESDASPYPAVAAASVLASKALEESRVPAVPVSDKTPDMSLLRKLYHTFPTSLPKETPSVSTVTQKAKKGDTMICYIFWNANVLLQKKGDTFDFPSFQLEEDTDPDTSMKAFIGKTYLTDPSIVQTVKAFKSQMQSWYYYISYTGKEAKTMEDYPMHPIDKDGTFWLPLVALKDEHTKIANINPFLAVLKLLQMDVGVSLDSLRKIPAWGCEGDDPYCPKELQDHILLGEEYSKQHPLLTSRDMQEYQQLAASTVEEDRLKLSQTYTDRVLHVAGKDGVQSLPIPNPYVAASYRQDPATKFDRETISRFDASGNLKSRNMDVLAHIVPKSITIDKPMTVSILESLWFCGQNPAMQTDPRCFPTRLLGELREYQEYRDAPSIKMIENWDLMKYFVVKLKHMIPGTLIAPFDLPPSVASVPVATPALPAPAAPTILPTPVPAAPTILPASAVPTPAVPAPAPVVPAPAPVVPAPAVPAPVVPAPVVPAPTVSAPVVPAPAPVPAHVPAPAPVPVPVVPVAPVPAPARHAIVPMRTGVLVPLRLGAIGLKPILPGRHIGVLPGIA